MASRWTPPSGSFRRPSTVRGISCSRPGRASRSASTRSGRRSPAGTTPTTRRVVGRYTVRGCRENTLVRDNAFVAAGELRVPVVQRTRWADYLELAAFYDYGRSWDVRPPHLRPLDMSSVGVGLRWALTVPAGRFSVRPQFEVYWGHRLRNVTDVGSGTAGGTIQDQGVQFQFLVAIQ